VVVQAEVEEQVCASERISIVVTYEELAMLYIHALAVLTVLIQEPKPSSRCEGLCLTSRPLCEGSDACDRTSFSNQQALMLAKVLDAGPYLSSGRRDCAIECCDL
jgi:hypothetical protein